MNKLLARYHHLRLLIKNSLSVCGPELGYAHKKNITREVYITKQVSIRRCFVTSGILPDFPGSCVQ